ncbi:MAG TPA: EAL domain-containing protein [Candidatus Binatia bacterium]|nr:EAL domain-containing protein [Candidatus Binatia bacterium]
MAERRVVVGPMMRLDRALRTLNPVTRRGIAPAARVWLFIGLLAALGAALYVGVVQGLPTPVSPITLPFWVVAVAFYVIEIKVVHLHFRRGAHSFSMSEIPVVIGLFFASPGDVVLAHALAGGAALFVHRRQPVIKLAFNVATFALGTGLAVVAFHGLAPGGGFGPVQCAAAILAVLVTNVFGMLSVTTVISLSEGRPRYEKLRHIALMSTTVATTNGTLALLAVALAIADVRAIWLLAIPLVALFLGYRSYLAEYQQHEMLALLYESSRIIQRSPEVDSALVGLLEHTRTMFRSERAEIRLYSPLEGGAVLATSVGPDGEATVMVPQDARGTDWLRSRLEGEAKAFIVSRDPGRAADATGPGLQGAMVAPLRNDTGPIGIMIVASRLGAVTSFTPDDVQLFETVANHAASALENGQLERSLAELSSLKEELRYQAYHDPLTGLANRTLFIEQVGRELSDRPDELPVVLFVDVDDFKMVNDSFGHGTGDALLVEIGHRLRGCVRLDDVAARLGGDEFGILLLDDAKLSRAQAIADRIIAALQTPFEIGGKELRVGASVGIAASTRAVEVPQELLRNADVAMYVAKSRGKGQAALFEPGMHATAIQRHDLSVALHRAVGGDEFLLRFQPVVSLDRGETVGAESLIRWRHPVRGIVSPADFISVAEQSDVILPIGRWVLVEACREARRWDPAHGAAPWVSVNLSTRQVQQASFLEDVQTALDVSGLPADRLILEVTETLMMEDLDGSAKKLAALKRMGVRTAIDDFGTGYSSLSYLRRFPVDMIKIARDFVDVADGDEDWAFAHAIVSLGQRLGLQIVAEGVERAEQADRLRLMGCDLAQGYLFARPLQAGAILRRIAAEQGMLRPRHVATPKPRLVRLPDVASA